MKASAVLKKIEDELNAEAERLYKFWRDAEGGQLAEETYHAANGWEDAARLVEKHRKALEVLGQ